MRHFDPRASMIKNLRFSAKMAVVVALSVGSCKPIETPERWGDDMMSTPGTGGAISGSTGAGGSQSTGTGGYPVSDSGGDLCAGG
jgi:hypothetical protein